MTEQKFRSKIKWRIGMSIVLLITGLFLIAMVLGLGENGIVVFVYELRQISEYLSSNPDIGHLDSFRGGYYYGISFGLTFASIVTLVQQIMILKNEKWFKKLYVKETDERNVEIFRKAFVMSWLIGVYTIIVSTFFVSSETMVALLCVLGIMAFSYTICYWFFQKKM